MAKKKAAGKDARKSKPSSRSVLDLSASEARAFFLKHDSYCNFDLPGYFSFDSLLQGVSRELVGKDLRGLRSSDPRDLDDASHTILSNKDGRFAWRPIQLCHPVLYVDLVHQITESANWDAIKQRFADFSQPDRIAAMSLPVQSRSKKRDKAEQILKWWQAIEQRSIELSLDYGVLIHADISDCYGAMYTHSIAWALHTKRVAKLKRRDFSLLGNVIDSGIQDMRQGQTNGIPQGSVLMDFIAEMVLGYADLQIAEAIQTAGIQDYQILRYRDDYRIFAESVVVGEAILKCIAESLVDLGFKLNSQKTKIDTDVIAGSVKKDKQEWNASIKGDRNAEKHLLLIRNHGMRYPNSGSLQTALAQYLNRVDKWAEPPYSLQALISIVIDIAFHSPKTQPTTMAILSKLLSLVSTTAEKQAVVDRTLRKFGSVPNTGYLEIWLQRATLHSGTGQSYREPLCKLANGESEPIWNSSWISSTPLRAAVDAKKVIKEAKKKKLPAVIKPSEVQLFEDY
ncbi:Reverse transcriptase (RNA-dependent DNA polymerase) [Posidoniimonas corsicana]|uniref:Reverse transcriptase (RNA-dependent DNA polymerase) n=1 Tax=Posidoniimonas corsicana TaxID=1938618 RepID=A0A5C5VBI1_9BACT|nr:RNA-directed DNA polymerase [Posidoniimonas corsicana]TWT35908.1 Reverse transcriptase (RNA-dependent DNA polymerase) [Posidoniimonas corsicana]